MGPHRSLPDAYASMSEYITWLPLRMATLWVAEREFRRGVTEEDTNDSPAIRAYLAAAEVPHPAPWCAAFVQWCAQVAADAKGAINPLQAVTWEAYVPDYVATLGKVAAQEAVIGDLFALYYPNLDRFGHIGFVAEINAREGWIRTVEGNSNTDGSREGTSVVAKRRLITPRMTFLHWSD